MNRLLSIIGILAAAGVVVLLSYVHFDGFSGKEPRAVPELGEKPEPYPIPDTAELPSAPPRIELPESASPRAENPLECPDKPCTRVIDWDPQPIARIPPRYPLEAARQELGGEVTLEFTIATDGSVKDIKVIHSTNPIFEQPPVDAVA